MLVLHHLLVTSSLAAWRLLFQWVISRVFVQTPDKGGVEYNKQNSWTKICECTFMLNENELRKLKREVPLHILKYKESKFEVI